MKVCTKCGRTKPLGEFPRQAASRDGHKPRCKECTREDREAREQQLRFGNPCAEEFARGYVAGKRSVPALDAETLKAAAALTHPDRHPPERQADATRVTAAINAVRSWR